MKMHFHVRSDSPSHGPTSFLPYKWLTLRCAILSWSSELDLREFLVAPYSSMGGEAVRSGSLTVRERDTLLYFTGGCTSDGTAGKRMSSYLPTRGI